MEVEALLFLGATLEQVELAELHDLGRVGGVREVTRVSILRTLSLHEERTNLGRLFRRPRISVAAFEMLLSVKAGLASIGFAAAPLSHRRRTAGGGPAEANENFSLSLSVRTPRENQLQ